MSTRRRASGSDPAEPAGLDAWVVAFASAVKNLTIYPASHPRVVERAQEFADLFTGGVAETAELVVQGERFAVGDEPVAGEHLAVAWLLQRCRETGLRGVRIERGCSGDDVVHFATELVACRPNAGKNLALAWSDDAARVRPLELVVEDHHAVGSRHRPGELPPRPTDTPALQALGDGYADLLMEVAERPQIKELLQTIERSSRADAGDVRTDPMALDVLGVIGELLPVDAPRGADELAATVEHILARVHCELAELLRQSVRVRGAELLRSAIDVARHYFRHQSPPVQRRDELPTGRPGDEEYDADLGALLAEFDTLPADPELRLPSGATLTPAAPALARELCGIYLFGLASATDAPHRRTRIELIVRLAQQHGEALADLLDIYLSPEERWTRLPTGVRAATVGALAAAGLDAFVRARGYVDAELISGGFPEVLIALPLLFGRDEDLPVLRSAFETLRPVLQNGGAEAAAKAGHLRHPGVVGVLARVTTPEVLLLLGHVESNDRLVHEHLCAFAKAMPLPEAEATVMRASEPRVVPPAYVRRLLRAAARGDVEKEMRKATGELLRSYVTTHRSRLDVASGLSVVKALADVPGPETEALLTRLARAGRFVNFTRGAKLLRAQARAALSAMQRRPRP